MAISNNEYSGMPYEAPTPQEHGDLHTRLDHRKMSTVNGIAQVHVEDDVASMTVQGCGFAVTPKFSLIRNPTALAMEPNQLRINYYYVFNDEIMTTLPSTVYTPIPVLRYSEPPYAQELSDLATRLFG